MGFVCLRAVAQSYTYIYNDMNLGSNFQRNLQIWAMTWSWAFDGCARRRKVIIIIIIKYSWSLILKTKSKLTWTLGLGVRVVSQVYNYSCNKMNSVGKFVRNQQNAEIIITATQLVGEQLFLKQIQKFEHQLSWRLYGCAWRRKLIVTVAIQFSCAEIVKGINELTIQWSWSSDGCARRRKVTVTTVFTLK